MKAGVLKETWPGETRVAVVPGVVPALAKAGIELLIESGAGDAAGFPDAQYAEKGALRGQPRARCSRTPRCCSRCAPSRGPTTRTRSRGSSRATCSCGFLDPLQRPEGAKALAARGVTSFALELVPRISRAQSMDALSSTATMVGYKAVLLAADSAAAHDADDDDRRGHDRAGARVRDRRGRRRPAGDRHRAPARRRGRGLRRAAGREGADPQPGRQVRRAAARDRRPPRTRAATRRRRTRASTGASASCWPRWWPRATS